LTGEKIKEFEEDGIRFKQMTEKEMLENFWKGAREYQEFISFNGRGFDVPFLLVRSAVHKVKPTKDLMSNRYLTSQRFDAKHIDLFDQLNFYGAVRRRGNLHLWSRVFGIKSPKAEGISGNDVTKLFKEKKFLEIARYNIRDLKATKELYEVWNEYITLIVAKELLGKYIVRKTEKGKLIGKIIETEAYIGPQDKASHAYKGKRTARNEAEYLTGGHIYIYLVYGMYWQLNITTAEKDQPECVLIRAIEPIINRKLKVQSSNFKTTTQSLELLKNLTNGPGKLCKWLNLDKSFYGEDLTKSKRIWLEDRKADVEPK